MVKIVSGIDPKEGGYNSKIWSSHRNTENFLSEEVVSNSAKSITESAELYSIHFFAQYFIFSKHKIILDLHGADRIGTISFSVALTSGEQVRSDKILIELNKLQELYNNKELSFHQNEKNKPNAEPITQKSGKQKKDNSLVKKENVYLYYNNEQLIKYFCKDSDYKKYKRIFFIDEEKYKGKDNDPSQSIQSDKEITFKELESSNDLVPLKPKKKNIIKSFAEMQLLGYSIILVYLGIFLGIAGFWFNQKWVAAETDKETVAKSEYDRKAKEVDDLNEMIKQKDITIKALTDSIVFFEKKINTILALSNNTNHSVTRNGINDNRVSTASLPQEIADFLRNDCITMTISDIDEKIKSFNNWNKWLNLRGFANFIVLIKKNPPTKENITTFIKENEKNFNPDDAYVKFVNYLNTKDADFFTNKKIDDIYNKTLKAIGNNYDYYFNE